jgi:hypothetical protein
MFARRLPEGPDHFDPHLAIKAFALGFALSAMLQQHSPTEGIVWSFSALVGLYCLERRRLGSATIGATLGLTLGAGFFQMKRVIDNQLRISVNAFQL